MPVQEHYGGSKERQDQKLEPNDEAIQRPSHNECN
jgi:hypothetical protein